MHIHSLAVYPVKSLAGIAVDSMSLDEFGPQGDRRWMIVDGRQKFVTQRASPELAMVSTRFDGADVVVSIPGEGEFRLVPQADPCDVEVWRDQVNAVLGAPEASEALSRFCGKRVYFVYMNEATFRRVDPDWVPAYRRVSFADGFPFLVTNTASLDELNTRLDQPVDMRRFRPNLVISGADAWAEDGWTEMMIGDVSISLVKPCSRCILTTVNPDTGVRSPDGQPLRMLASYRKTPDGVMFGVNGVHNTRGLLSVGDRVSIV
ncbi:MOSC domain-containing protein [Marinobacter confluentis]|uniref:MOSC domain-containing protein n=1 Tax=Marinobacter confluentis TaxID=1697557 RepID=A0A4Z1C5K6_9GAMM|nr:MOSC N-terminal beta barrel domain-containing protein [Marinobacter confluentis]TGN41781.1 MOSC domain-containing protein [Marinobacter confluentis]